MTRQTIKSCILGKRRPPQDPVDIDFPVDAADDSYVAACLGGLRPARDVLPTVALAEALGPAGLRRLREATGIAVVVEVPSADWIPGIELALQSLSDFAYVCCRSGASRTQDKPNEGNERVGRFLSEGERVAGVSQSPSRFLPATLVASADLFVRIASYADGVAYSKGDRVLFRGRVYQCLADHVIGLYKVTTVVRNGVPSSRVTYPYWQDLGVSTPMGDPRNPSYANTIRGRKTIEAVLMRMRAAALRKLGALRVSKVFPWEAARDLSLVDEVRMLVRDDDGILPYRGKVEQIVRKIEPDGKRYVEVTIVACVGTGRNDPVAPVKTPYANGYSTAQYTSAVATKYVPATVPGYVANGTGGESDIEYVLSGDALIAPIDFFKLSNPAYSVLSARFDNDADLQLAQVRGLIGQNRDPRKVTQDYPSTVTVTMRPLRTEGNLIRNLFVHAALTRSKRGVDLVNGGEP